MIWIVWKIGKNNAPIVMYMGFEAVQKGTLAEFYRACVIDFFKKIVGSGMLILA